MATEMVQDQKNIQKQIKKQMGCMGGFLQLFDGHHLFTGRKHLATKRLPPPPTVINATLESVESTITSPELEKMKQNSPDIWKPAPELRSPSPVISLPIETPPKSPLVLPIFELKTGGTKSTWKLSKESPRLSLDSRATFDSKGSLQPMEIRTKNGSNNCENSGDGADSDGDEAERQSPSVIARLMGLEQPLPNSSPQRLKKTKLRRSASDSKIPVDLLQNRFIDGNNFQSKQLKHSQSFGNNSSSNVMRDNAATENHYTDSNRRPTDSMDRHSRNSKPEAPKNLNRGLNRKSFHDSDDFFPEPKQTVPIYGEIEKRLQLRELDKPTKDLETLKQILDALQLKGLLHHHSRKRSESKQISRRNFVYDEAPIVVMTPSISSSSLKFKAGVRRSLEGNSPSVSTRLELQAVDRNVWSPTRLRSSSPPTRNVINAKRSNSLLKSKPLSGEINKKVNESTEQQRRVVSPVRSPKLVSTKGIGSDQNTAISRSTRSKRSRTEICRKEKIITTVVLEDESSSISDSTLSISSPSHTERLKMEEYKDGSGVCWTDETGCSAVCQKLLQPSPVSVLDSSFHKDDSSSSPSPSPVVKRSIYFEEQSAELQDEIWSPAISPVESKPSAELQDEMWSSAVYPAESKAEDDLEDSDFVYIWDILKASTHLTQDSDVFTLLEKQQYLDGKDTSKVSRLQRKLTFDTVAEILDRNRELPPWKAFSSSDSGAVKPIERKIWSEFQRIREQDTGEDLFEVIYGGLKRDLARDSINGWGDYPVEMSEAVSEIERVLLTDLVGEMIRDLPAFAVESTMLAPRRKLVF